MTLLIESIFCRELFPSQPGCCRPNLLRPHSWLNQLYKSDLKLGLDDFDNQKCGIQKTKRAMIGEKDLLDICKLNDFLVLKGHMTGDVFGKLIIHNWNGSSVVD